MTRIIFILLQLFLLDVCFAQGYRINYTNSKIEFSGMHGETGFTGQFNDWQGQIKFDPDNLDQSHFKAIFLVETVDTGNEMYDETLLSKDWFNVSRYKDAIFEAMNISKLEQDNYEVIGNLTIKGITQELKVPLTIQLNDKNAVAKAEFRINRLDFDIGSKSDPGGDWVSKEITIKAQIDADINEHE